MVPSCNRVAAKTMSLRGSELSVAEGEVGSGTSGWEALPLGASTFIGIPCPYSLDQPSL